jgi:UDP-N-acetylmuramate dehydrogenase
MKVTQRPSLKAFNTFGVEASAGLMLTLETEEDLLSLPPFDPGRDLVLGGGSNVLFASDVPGSVFHNRITGREIVETDDKHVLIEAGAGENWHDLVRWTLENGFSGLENLSLIPGLAGAAPIQNIGAYGVDLATVLESVTAWDLSRCTWKTFSNRECQLAYRDSFFKSGEPGRFLITSIRLRLNRCFRPQLEYAGLREELSQPETSQLTALAVSDAVIRLRKRKLPDPLTVGNAGSFFKNPVLDPNEGQALLERFPGLPVWELDGETVKLSAAWMIQHCGLKGYLSGGAGISDQHALIIVNHGNATGQDVLHLARHVQATILDTFGVSLEIEPRIIDISSTQERIYPRF